MPIDQQACRAKAEEFARLAAQAQDRVMRDAFFSLTADWLAIAEQAAYVEKVKPEASQQT